MIPSLGVLGIVLALFLVFTIYKGDIFTKNAAKNNTNVFKVWVWAYLILAFLALLMYWSLYYAFVYPFIS